MEQYDQYRIELDHDDIERILAEYAEKLLNEKGYVLEHSNREDGHDYPSTTFRGVKTDNKDIETD